MNQTYLNQAGSFECVVEQPESGWFGESKEKGTPFIRIPVAVSEGTLKGQTAVYNAWLSAGAFDNTIARLTEVFGFDGDLPSLHLGKTSFAGMPCNITTEMETYEGKTRCKIKWLNPPGGGSAKPMDEAKVKGLLALLTSKAKAIAKATKANTPTPAMAEPTTNAPADNEDVPF